MVDEEAQFGDAPLAASQGHPFGLAQGQRLFGSHRDEVAFDFGHKAEGKAEHLAVDGVVEGIAVFGRVDGDLLLEASAHDGHDFGEGTAQSRDFGHDKGVARFQLSDYPSEFSLSLVFLSTYNLGYPPVDVHVAGAGKTSDFVGLVVEVLSAGADS